jgi:hypothetical protein
MNLDELIQAYEIDVAYPEVSGMEHLEMLMTRSKIERRAAHMSAAQRERVQTADQSLLQQAESFFSSIAEVADLKSWREDEHVHHTHWWWYLDVIVTLPVNINNRTLSFQCEAERSPASP